MYEALLSIQNYTPWGDVAVIAICAVLVILITTSFVNRTRSFYIFIDIIAMLAAASAVNIYYHGLPVEDDPDLIIVVYGMRILYHALLLNLFFLFSLYITVVSDMEHSKSKAAAIVSSVMLAVFVGADIVRVVSGIRSGASVSSIMAGMTGVFAVAFVFYVALILFLMHNVQKLMYKRVMSGFYGTMAVAVVINLAQIPFNQASLTTMGFVLPVIAMIYIMHSNPYNVTMGTLDNRAFEDMIRNLHTRRQTFIFMSLLLPEFNEEGKELPVEIRALTRSYAVDFFRNCMLFQISNGHIILLASERRNPGYEDGIENMLSDFQERYRVMHHPYKIVIGRSVDDISDRNEYVSLIKTVHSRMQESTVYRISEDDIAQYNRNVYILHELTDIYNRHDLNDPRVLAYCQPVYNLKTDRFDTAEALMRIKLEKTGLVLPDQFIPLAESHGYIHVLTEIILHKTCMEIRKLLNEGFLLTRISVNVSVLELKDEGFCDDIIHIISGSSIPGDKIAIELTESRSEADFMIMKRKIDELRGKGIRFYLDDFGTGYSNMERILELPFDIIKFDRSLVIASGTDERSERIVENLAHVFKDMNYSLLYEGVENSVDEERCEEMSASYLQGFKYSRPVPIEKLRNFLPTSA